MIDALQSVLPELDGLMCHPKGGQGQPDRIVVAGAAGPLADWRVAPGPAPASLTVTA